MYKKSSECFVFSFNNYIIIFQNSTKNNKCRECLFIHHIIKS